MHQVRAELDAAVTKLPNYIVEWSDESCNWTERSEGPTDIQPQAVRIAAEPVGFEFVAPAIRLDRLRVQLATYARQNSVEVLCTLWDRSGALLATATTPADAIRDNKFANVMDFEEIEFVIGAQYRVELSSPRATDGDSFAVWVKPVRAGCFQVPRQLAAFRNKRSFIWRAGEGRAWTGLAAAPDAALAILGPTDRRPDIARSAARTVAAAFPETRFEIVEANAPAGLWPILMDRDAVVFANAHDADLTSAVGFDALCFELYRRGVCTIYIDDSSLPGNSGADLITPVGSLRGRLDQRMQTQRRCRFILDAEALLLIDSDTPAGPQSVAHGMAAGDAGSLGAAIAAIRHERMPRVSLVSVLYRKADIIGDFIECVLAQDYPGQIDLILVDDRSPEREAEIALLAQERLTARGIENRSIRVIYNAENLGNCASRLSGLDAAAGEINIVMDCDCLIGRGFVSAHVFEHARADVDVVIGPLNIESGDRDPLALLAELERDPDRIAAESNPQDPVQPDGFLNCITRNFSVKRRRVEAEALFDLDFSYSLKPGSGFGWEDVEMGYRLYAKGAVIRFTEGAFSIHATHPSSVADALKVRGSMRNYERLFAKHPEMEQVARRWATDTYDKILHWAGSEGVDGGEDQRSLERRFAAPLDANINLLQAYRPGARRLRVLSYRWHVAHQYELYKLPHDFTLVTDVGDNGMVNGWSHDQRPLRSNVRFARFEEIDPRQFDVAILHFDENVAHPNLCNNVIPASWGDPFFALLDLPGIPKVAICHGTPQFMGQYARNGERIETFATYEHERQALVALLANAGVKVVCNSHQALAEWGFDQGQVIWHGFDPQQFPPGTQRRDILALHPDRHRPHYRGFWEHSQVERRLDPGIRIETAAHAGAAIDPRGTNDFATRNFRSYVDRIRQFTVYLNTTLRSPMPRSRGEAMMTGVIPVCLNNHDVGLFIQNGVNGFYSDDPDELADWINALLRDPQRARQIGAAARATAIDVFNHDRYLGAWQRLLTDAVG
ncbi:MAG: hypothetical protein JWM75_3088 [Sphingomonas bacterium]|nr:hypothetical protein [Sphingomonas bacterium]